MNRDDSDARPVPWALIVALAVLAVPAIWLPIDLIGQMRASVWFRDHAPGPVSANRIVVESQACTCPDWRIVEGASELGAPEGFVELRRGSSAVLTNAAGERFLNEELDAIGVSPFDDFWDLPSGYGTYVFEGEVVEIGRPQFSEPDRPLRRVFRVDRFYPYDRSEFELWTTNDGARVLWGWLEWMAVISLMTVVSVRLRWDRARMGA